VLVPLAQACEELEAVTIIDLLRRAGVEVITAGLDDQPVTASRGVVIVPDTSLDEVLNEDFDMMVLPGGLPGADYLRDDERIISLLQRFSREDKYTAAICAAPQVLARAGLLDHHAATSYPGVLDALDLPAVNYTGSAVEVDGKVVTSRGPGTAMDFALQLIELLLGKQQRDSVEQGLCR
jgi:4-methyl-5(b-hydroxyethyl)-thiazole monophosphate biosynthesis